MSRGLLLTGSSWSDLQICSKHDYKPQPESNRLPGWGVSAATSRTGKHSRLPVSQASCVLEHRVYTLQSSVSSAGRAPGMSTNIGCQVLQPISDSLVCTARLIVSNSSFEQLLWTDARTLPRRTLNEITSGQQKVWIKVFHIICCTLKTQPVGKLGYFVHACGWDRPQRCSPGICACVSASVALWRRSCVCLGQRTTALTTQMLRLDIPLFSARSLVLQQRPVLA